MTNQSANMSTSIGSDQSQPTMTNVFYEATQSQGHSIGLILTAIILNCIGIPGFLMNLSVVWVTVRYRALHGTANFLLALTSLFEMGHESGHLLFLWTALSGQNFLPFWLAFRIICLPAFCIGGIFASMVSTGVDRMLCIIFPHFHSALNLPVYLSLHGLFCLGTGVWLCMAFFHCAQLYPDYPVTGYISDLIIGECAPAYTYSSMLFNMVTILLYMLVGIIIYVQSRKLASSEAGQQSGTSQRLFRSLVVIIVANIGGYIYVSMMRAFVIPLLQLDSTAQWYVNSYDGILLNVSSAINAPVLYFLSKDYRSAFSEELGKFRKTNRIGMYPNMTIVVNSSQQQRSQKK